MNSLVPIVVPKDWPEKYMTAHRQSLREKSFFSWLFSFTMSKYRALDNDVESKLKERKVTIEKAWENYPEFIEVVKTLQRLLNEHLWDFYPIFIPEDSYYLLGQMLTDDLCEIEMIMAIEEEFCIEFNDKLFDQDKSMLEIVKVIKNEIKTNKNLSTKRKS